MQKETWAVIKGFEDRYTISTHGRIMSYSGKYSDPTLINPNIDTQGYYTVSLRRKPVRRSVRVHTLMCETFLPKPQRRRGKLIVNHKDGNKLNNRLDNLEWCTYKENAAHAVRTGLHNLKGERHPHSKVTQEDVREMRRLYATGNYRHKDIAERFGICRRQAGDIINGVNWGWLGC